MKIAHLETIPLAIPFNPGADEAGFKGQNWTRINILLVRLETDTGITAWGDCFAYNCLGAVKWAFDTMVAPNAVGEAIDDIPALMWRQQQMLNLFGRNGILQYAFSGLDIALWDAAAKQAGRTLGRHLGADKPKTSLPGYSSLFKYGDAEIVAEKCRTAIEEGYGYVKLHETDIPEIAAAREACGDGFPIMVDTNCPWTPGEALAAANAMKRYDIMWLEEPIFPPEDFHALARLQREAGIPLAAGENACTALEFEAMFEAGAVTYAQPSVTKIGGVTEWMKTSNLAAERQVTLMPHSPYFGPGFLATLQMTSGLDGEPLVEWFELNLETQLFGDAILPKSGHFEVPQGPGLGLEPDPDVMRDYGVSAD